MGDTSFPKLRLVKPSWRLIKELTTGREALYNWLVKVIVTPGMKRIISPVAETCPICTVNNPDTGPTRGLLIKGHSDQKDVSQRRLADWFHCPVKSTGQFQESFGAGGHIF